MVYELAYFYPTLLLSLQNLSSIISEIFYFNLFEYGLLYVILHYSSPLLSSITSKSSDGRADLFYRYVV